MIDRFSILRDAAGAARTWIVLVAAFGSVGCVGTMDPISLPTPQLPESWQGTALDDSAVTAGEVDPADMAAWWRQLEDPVLERVVEVALAGSLDLQAAAARVEEARARRGLSQADLGPSVSAGLDARTTEPLGGGVATEAYTASLTTSWEADLFGAKRSAVEASHADLEAAADQLNAARVSLVAEVVVAYADLRVAEARLEVIDEGLESREQTYRLTDFREQAGLASRLEVEQALTSREQTRASRSPFERAAASARLRLELLAGGHPGSLDELLASSAADLAPVPSPPAVTIDVPAEALRRRPDVRVASHRLDAALARLGVAEAARYPKLRLSGSIDGQSTDLEQLFDADSFLASLLAGLTAPVFESGRIEQNILIERSRVEQEALAYREQVLQALSEVESALFSLRYVNQQVTALDGAIRAARQTSDLADQRYAAGLVDLLVVLDSQRTLLSLEEQRVAALGERLVTFSNLYRALGGGWQASTTGHVVATHTTEEGASDA